MQFFKDLEHAAPQKDQIALWWLGQAGFMIKTHGGCRILIDPYLSDYVNRLFCETEGPVYRRMTPMCFAPEQLKPDIFLSSHEHPDHLDIDSIPGLLACGGVQGFVNEPSREELEKNDVSLENFCVIHKGDEKEFAEFKLIVTDCDHGDDCPEALGFYFDFGFLSVYYAGDTHLNWDRLQFALDRQPDLVLLPINGAYGNLNALDAAKLAAAVRAKTCIPMHFWTFPAHDVEGGTPRDALREFPQHAPDCSLYLATPGETMFFGRDGKLL